MLVFEAFHNVGILEVPKLRSELAKRSAEARCRWLLATLPLVLMRLTAGGRRWTPAKLHDEEGFTHRAEAPSGAAGLCESALPVSGGKIPSSD